MSNARQPVTHDLKCESEYFDSLPPDGPKTFEFRIDDRNFMVGDILRLTRTKNGSFGRTPNQVKSVRVTYILRNFKGLQPGYCIMAVVPEGGEG
jgi:ParB family chromosome partitioning protein